MPVPVIPLADVLALETTHFACAAGTAMAAYLFPNGIPVSLVSLAVARAAGLDVSFVNALVPSSGPIAEALADARATAASLRGIAQDAHYTALAAVPFDPATTVALHGARVAAEADARAIEDYALVDALAAVYA